MISPKVAAVLRMLDSEQGDAVAALGKARLLLSREGLTFGDLSRALEHGGQPGPAPDPDLDEAIRRYTEAATRAQGAQEAQRRAEAKRQAETEAFWAAKRQEEERKNAPLRAEVIARYGSEDAVEALTLEEEALRAAVLPWATFHSPPFERYVAGIDGMKDAWSDIPPRVLAAIAAALPLPISIPDAKAEMERWDRRDRDLRIIRRCVGDIQLDLPAALRERIVRRLFEEDLRATSLDEVLLRQRHLVEHETFLPEVEAAVLADLEALAARQAVQYGRGASQDDRRDGNVHNGRSTTTQRREDVMALLRDPTIAALSDREIARHVGVAPTTVGNLRRRLAKQRQGDLFARRDVRHGAPQLDEPCRARLNTCPPSNTQKLVFCAPSHPIENRPGEADFPAVLVF